MTWKRRDFPPPNERFWAGVHKTEKCWVWARSITSEGYGRFWFNRKHVGSHRYSWELHNGPIPDGKSVLHHCDNPKCVRPEHLYVGTLKENCQDAIKRGRFKPWGNVMKKDRKPNA